MYVQIRVMYGIHTNHALYVCASVGMYSTCDSVYACTSGISHLVGCMFITIDRYHAC